MINGWSMIMGLCWRCGKEKRESKMQQGEMRDLEIRKKELIDILFASSLLLVM